MIDIYEKIAPKFRSKKAFSNEWLKKNDQLVERGVYLDFKNIIDKFPDAPSIVTSYIDIYGQLIVVSLAELRYCMAVAIRDGRLDEVAVATKNNNYLLGLQLRFYNFCRLKNNPEFEGVLPPVASLGQLGVTVMLACIFLEKEKANSIFDFSLNLFDCDAVGVNEAPPTQSFIFRLLEVFFGKTPYNWSECGRPWSIDPCKEEPLFAELWDCWNTENLELIEVLLIKLANRHTFHASRNNKDGSRDFEGQAEQYPIDVFFIMRLREWSGLKNPSIKHRITESPFDRLPEVVETIEFSDELKNLMKKIRKEIPDFDEVINKSKTREWEMLL